MIKRPATQIRMMPSHQSIYPCSPGRKNRKTAKSGITSTTDTALPTAERRTASSPRPCIQRAWAGRTEIAVSASGTPKKVLGTQSVKVWTTRALKSATPHRRCTEER